MQRELRSARTVRNGSLARLLLSGALTLLLGMLLGATSSAIAAAAPEITVSPGPVTGSQSLTWGGTLPAGATATCALDGAAPVACGSDGVFTHTTTAGDGRHTFVVEATVTVTTTDDQGTTTTTTETSSATDTVVVDTTDPVVVVVAPEASRSTTVTWGVAVTDSTDVSVWCELVGPEPAAGDCSAGSFTATVATPGDHVLTATAQDAAGNTGSGSGSYTLLPPPPAAPTVTVSVDPADPTVVSWSFAVPSGAVADCSLVGPGSWSLTALGCSSPWTTTLSGGDGAYTASVVLTDVAGTSEPGTASHLLDTVAPEPPTVSGPGSSTNAAQLSWTWDAAGDDSWCRLELGGTTVTDAACTSPFVVDDPADGDYQVFVTLIDAAGNRSAESASGVTTVDRTGPDAPAITSAPSSPHRGPSFTWNHEVTDTAECRVVREDGSAVLDWAPCTSGSVAVDLSTESDGPFTFEIRQRDALGNTGPSGTSTVVLDRTAPPAPGVSTPLERSNTRTITVSWTGEGTATCSVVSASGATLSSVAACTGTIELTGLADGTYTIEVRLTDEAGNTSDPGSTTYTLDTTGPDQPVVEAAQSPSTSRTLSFTWTGDGTAACSLLVDGAVLVTEGCAGGAHAFSLDGRPDGAYTVSVVLHDDLGNASPAGTDTYVLDTTPPGVPVFSVEPASPGADRRPTWEFASDPGGTLLCTLTGPTGAVLLDGICSSPLVQDLSTRADGLYTLEVRARDGLGNTSAVATSTYVLDTEPPATPTVVSEPATSSSRTPTWTLSAADGASLHCRLVGPGALLVHDAPCGTTFTPTLPDSGPDGTYALEAWAVDPAGNRSVEPATSSYLLDTVVPADPVLIAEPGTGSVRTPTWTVGTEAGSTLLCGLTGPDGTSVAVRCGEGTTGSIGPDAPDGAYVLTVQARDAAGNVSGAVTSTYLLDTVAPEAPQVQAPAGPSGVREWTVTWTGEAGATATCTLTREGSVVETTACVSGHTFVLLADGHHDVAIVLTDAAGNTGVAGTASYLLDTVAPAAPVVEAPTGPSNDPSWPVRWSVEEGTVTCVLSSGGTELARVVGCTSPHVVDLTASPDGTYALTLWGTDDAGNASDPRTVSYELDREAPAPATWSSEPGTSSDRTPTWGFTLPLGTTADCTLLAPDGAVLFNGACTSPWTAPELTGADGAYRLEVRARDAAGNLSEPVASTYVLDTVPPGQPVFTVEPPPSYDPAPVWVISTDDGTTLRCTLVGPSGEVVVGGPCGTTSTADVSGWPDGVYVLDVVATDAAGNVSPAARSSFRYDTTPPPAPTFGAEPDISSSRTPTWEIATADGTTLRCTLTGPAGDLVRDGACDTTFTASLTDLPDGAYTLAVRAVDEAGNVSDAATSTYVLDTEAPGAPVFTAEPAATGSTGTPAWEFTADEGTTECRLDGPLGPGTWSPCAGAYTATLDGLPDGTYELHVRAVDAAGNAGAEVVGTYVYDTAAPAPVGITPPVSPSSSRSPQWSFTAEAGARLECRVGDATVWSACEATLTLDLTDAPDGEHVVAVRAVDEAGNTGEATSSVYVLDTVAPPPATFTDSPSTSSDRHPTWSFTTEAGTASTCRLVAPDGAVVLEGGCASPVTADLTGRSDGLFTLTVRVVDAAGNVSEPASSTYLLDTTPPDAPSLTAPATPGDDRDPTWGITSTGSNECRLLSGDGGVLVDWALCGSSYTAALAGSPDGVYVVEVRTRDVAGNVSAVAGSTYVLDTAPPPAPAVSAPPSPSAGATPGFTVVLTEDGTQPSCRVLRDGAVLQDWYACSAGTVVVDLTGLPDGTYRLEVRLTDAATNIGDVAGADYAYDTTAPAAVDVTAPASPGNVRGPVWTFETEPLATLECRIGDSGAWAVCEDSISLDLSTAGDGEYAVWVRATDRAGNVGPQTRSAYVLDTRPPAAPTVTAPTGPSPLASPVWTWTSEPLAAASCTLRRSGAVVWSGACTSPWTTKLTIDGTYRLTVVLTDAAGNPSAPGTASYVLDSVPPEPPVVVGPSSPNLLQRPLFSITSEAGARTECRVLYAPGAGAPRVVSGWAACTSPTSFYADRPGHYVLEVRAVDAAGNVSGVTALSYVYDPDATTGLVDLQAPPSPSQDRTPVWTFQPVEGATVSCRLVGPGSDGDVLVDGPCTTSVAPRLPLETDGAYWVFITVSDALGNTGVNELVYVLDTTGPSPPAVTPDGVESRDPVVGWDWTSDATAVSWQCRLLRDGAVVRDWSTCTPGRQDLGPTGEGAYVLEVRGLDALGNAGAVGAARYRFDLTAPAALGLTSLAGEGGRARTVPWTFGVPADAVTVTCGVRSGNVFVRRPTACQGGSYVMDLSGLPEATYSLVVLFTDLAGNVREQVGHYVLSAAFVPRPAPSPPAPPPAPLSPRAPGPSDVVVEARPRPAPATSLDLQPVQDPLPGLPIDLTGAGTGIGPGAAPDGASAAETEEASSPLLGLPSGPVSGARAVEALKDVAEETIRRPTLPIALVLVVGLFLLVQNRIDRRDAKLAGADIDEEPELEFAPVRTLLPPARPGGATA